MAATRKLVVQVLGDARGLSKTLKQAERDSMTFGQKIADSSKRMAVPAAAAFGAMSAAALSFAKAAADDQRSSALLAQQLKATTGATNLQIAASEAMISSLSRQVGIADDELRPALAQLVRATGDVGKAQQLLKLGLDVSAGSGKSLSTVVMALSRASQGQFTALKRLGIPLDDNIIKSKDFNAVLQVLSSTFGGQATVAANTAAGKFARVGVAMNEAKESIGAALLPALEALLPKLIGLGRWAEKNAGIIAGVGTAIAAVSGAVLIGNAALKAWAIASKLAAVANFGLASSNLAVQASTIVGIGAAVAAAGTIGILVGKMSSAADAATSMSDAMLGAGDDVRYGYVPVITSAKEATTALFGVMGATTNYAIDMGNAIKGGMMGAVTSVFGMTQAVANTVPALDKGGSAADKAAQKLKSFRDAVKATKDSVRQYVANIQQQIASSVSLADSFKIAEQEQADAAQALTDALQARKDAYAALDQAKQTDDAIAYAKALEDVKIAEANLAVAQAAKPRDYTAVFRSQIDAAKSFATNLKSLLATGNLSRSALQQLLALGPVAGSQVAQDLLNGIGGFTAASLSSDLAAIEAAGKGVGMSVPGVSQLLGAGIGGTANNYYITVQTGVGDKAAISREIVDLLKIYNRSNGSIPVRVG